MNNELNFKEDTLQAVVISMEKSVDRRSQVTETLKDFQIEWSFLNAIDGRVLKTYPPEYQKEKVRRLLGFELTAGEIGCFLSHRQAWLSCIEKDKVTIIFEDDFLMNDWMLDAVGEFKDHEDWDVVRFQGLAEVNKDVIRSCDRYNIVRNLSDPLGTTCYMVNPRSANILYEKSSSMFEPVDHFIEHKKFHGLNVLAVLPYPIESREQDSTIGERSDRKPIRGTKKLCRSFHRFLDRALSNNPWF